MNNDNINENTNQSIQDNNLNQNNNVNEQIIESNIEIPCASDEKMVISTIKEKKKTNFLPAIIIIASLFLGIYFMDDIVSLFDKKNNGPVINKNMNEDNLVDGFIVIDDNTAYMTRENVRFYNFNKFGGGDIIKFNYISYKNYIESKGLSIYVELYNNKKELIYKDLFDVGNITTDEVKTYDLNLNNNIYSMAKYAKIKKYTESELKEKSLLTCRFKEVGQGFDISYKNIYNFIGDELVNIDVNKEVNITVDSTLSNKYKEELNLENKDISSYGIKTIFTENKLKYMIDLNNLPGELNIPYTKKDTPSVVKNNDALKDWECE